VADTDNADKEEKKGKSGGPSPDFVIPPDIVKEIPENIRPRVIKEMTTFMASSFMGQVPIPNPIISKINESHIDKIIDNAEKEDARQAESGKSIRRYIFGGFIAILAVVIALVIFLVLQNSTSILVNLIIALFSFAGGLGAGFGAGKYLQKQ
jgi:hypothetical protein